MAMQCRQTGLEQHLGRAGRPLPLALHRFQAFQKTAYIDQNAVQLRPDGIQRPLDPDSAGKRNVRQLCHAARPTSPSPTPASQRVVTDGISEPRVKSARSLSPARNSSSEMKAHPLAVLRR